MIKRKAVLPVLLSLATLGSGQPRERNDIPYQWKGVERIVAIGDVHGAYDGLVSILEQSGLIDQNLRWIGGNTHLVQLGDVVDRGPDSRKAMDLLIKLEEQAEDAGGRVHVLIGNHEAMNILGIIDHISPEEFESYKTFNSRKLRDRVFENHYRKLVEEAKNQGEEPPSRSEARTEFEAKYPLGYVEHRLAFAPEGEYGRWILRHNVAIRINDTIFSHADWSERWALLGLAEVNRRVREELASRTLQENGVTFAPDSPVQNRQFSTVSLTREAQEAHQTELARVLEALGGSRIVVGHTLTQGMVEPRFGGKHISIDAGMLGPYGGGQHVALEIEGDRLRAIHPHGRVELPAYLDQSTLLSYLKAVSAVDPENVAAQVHLIDRYRLDGELTAARRELEELFELEQEIPLPYAHSVCNLFDELATSNTEPNAWVTKHCSN